MPPPGTAHYARFSSPCRTSAVISLLAWDRAPPQAPRCPRSYALGRHAVEAEDTLRAAYPASTVIAEPLDVGERDAPAKLDALLGSHGLYLDVLVNNAGIGLGGNFTDSTRRSLTNWSRPTSPP